MIRKTSFKRNTHETDISGELNLDECNTSSIQTGIGFLDHMLTLLAFHGGISLSLTCKGDLEVCPHHTIEDIAITLGKACQTALGEKKQIRRYGMCYMPMDEALTRTCIDISGRAVHVFRGGFSTPAIGAFPTEMVNHFFYSFAINATITLHQEILYGANDHHIVESLFKGFARAFRDCITIEDSKSYVPSTKGIL